jgi:uncharacterized protein
MRIVATQASGGSFTAVPDLRRRLPGRGAWLHPSPDCLDLALRRRALVRALRLAGPLDVTALAAAVAEVAGSEPPEQVDRSGRSDQLRRSSEPEAGYSADEHPMSTQQ